MTTDDTNAAEITAPSWLLALFEAPRALTEASSLVPLNSLLKNLPCGDGHAVMTLPGFLASDRSTRTLRRYMRIWGYDAYRWEQGRNLGLSRTHDVEAILDARLGDLYQQSGGKVSLVGWSLGGLFAREMARRNPQWVRSVITLGSPLGDPRATNAWRLYELISGIRIDDEVIRQRVEKLRAPMPDVPVTAIYSKTDAVVAWQIAKLPSGDKVENIGIATSHLGMGFNPAVLYAIADRLRQADDDWRPFEISGFRKIFYH
jgi:pimeloyl-ACP methyl ester carboxylesterase